MNEDYQIIEEPDKNNKPNYMSVIVALVCVVSIIIAGWYIYQVKFGGAPVDDDDGEIWDNYEADMVVNLTVGENYTYRSDDWLYVNLLSPNETFLDDAITRNYTVEGEFGDYVWVNCTFTAISDEYDGELFASFRTNYGVMPEDWSWGNEDYVYRIKFIVSG